MATIQAEITAVQTSDGSNNHYEITYTDIAEPAKVLAVDEFSSGGVDADLVIRDVIRDKCATLEADVLRIGSDVRIKLGDKITGDSFISKSV